MSEFKYTHCVEFHAFGLNDNAEFGYMPLHMLCVNEEEANTFADMLKRDKVQYSTVVVTELDAPIVETVNEND